MISTAHAAVDAAAEVIRRYFRQRPNVDVKIDRSPVTIADQEAEIAMRNIISNAFPSHVILGEEHGQNQLKSRFTWVLDPIDGTKAFIAGRPTFGTLLALCIDGIPVLGIIDQCITRERWVGTPSGTTLNGEPVNVNPNRNGLAEVSVHATTPDMFMGADRLAWNRVKEKSMGAVYGSDCYAYALLASGCVDAVVEADLKVWDFAALAPVVLGAGGWFTDWEGEEVSIDTNGRVIAAGAEAVGEELVDLLTGSDEERETSSGIGQISNDLPIPGMGNGLPADPGEGNLESMTGYGEKTVREGNVEVTVSMRSVNGRHCEVQLKGAKILAGYDAQVVSMVKQDVVRGKVHMAVTINSGREKSLNILPVDVDKAAAKSAKILLDELAEATGLKKEATLADILTFSEVLARKESLTMTEELFEVVKQAVRGATADLRSARRREGAILLEDLLLRSRKMQDILSDIKARAPERVVRERKRLENLLKDVKCGRLDERRLEQEVTLYADRADVTEEVVRLEAHLQMFDMTLFAAHEPVGQRLNFLLMEMNREATTIGSKSLDAPIAHLGVLIKEEIEKIREQVQNVR